MALNPNALYGALQANRASGGLLFGGPNFDRLAQGVAVGVAQWAVTPPNVAIVGAATGIIGAGAVIPAASKVIVPPTDLPMRTSFASAGLVGPLGLPLATVMTLGISQGFSATAQYAGVSAGVGVGQDIAKVVSTNAASLAGILKSSLGAFLGAGGGLLHLVTGLSVGIAGLVLLGTGTGTIAGAPIFPFTPSAGATISVMV